MDLRQYLMKSFLRRTLRRNGGTTGSVRSISGRRNRSHGPSSTVLNSLKDFWERARWLFRGHFRRTGIATIRRMAALLCRLIVRSGSVEVRRHRSETFTMFPTTAKEHILSHSTLISSELFFVSTKYCRNYLFTIHFLFYSVFIIFHFRFLTGSNFILQLFLVHSYQKIYGVISNWIFENRQPNFRLLDCFLT